MRPWRETTFVVVYAFSGLWQLVLCFCNHLLAVVLSLLLQFNGLRIVCVEWSCLSLCCQRVLLERIPRVHDVQSAWLLLLHCASARANYQLRPVLPDATADFATTHDAGLWRCLCSILQFNPAQPDSIRETAIVPLSQGGFGLHSASRTRVPAFWSSWADCLGMIHKRHPDVAAQLVHHLEGYPNTPSLQAAAGAARSLRGVQGFEPPSWEALAHGVRPAPRQPDDFEPGCE